MSRDPEPGAPRRREGTALLIALALLILTSALLAGSSAAAHSASRAARSFEATATANTESRVAAARFLAGWTGLGITLAPGAELVTTSVPQSRGIGALPVASNIRVIRLSTSLYVLSVECKVGPAGAPVATRRLRMLLTQATPADSTITPGPPRPIGQWAVADLY